MEYQFKKNKILLKKNVTFNNNYKKLIKKKNN